jgi:chromosome segregation ATPase
MQHQQSCRNQYEPVLRRLQNDLSAAKSELYKANQQKILTNRAEENYDQCLTRERELRAHIGQVEAGYWKANSDLRDVVIEYDRLRNETEDLTRRISECAESRNAAAASHSALEREIAKQASEIDYLRKQLQRNQQTSHSGNATFGCNLL